MGSATLTTRHLLYPQKFTLTSPASGGRSVGIVRSRTKATELLLLQVYFKEAVYIVTTHLWTDKCGELSHVRSIPHTYDSWKVSQQLDSPWQSIDVVAKAGVAVASHVTSGVHHRPCYYFKVLLIGGCRPISNTISSPEPPSPISFIPGVLCPQGGIWKGYSCEGGRGVGCCLVSLTLSLSIRYASTAILSCLHKSFKRIY
jgi:hypothetical protein